LNYVQGDATEPVSDGAKIIAHICNDQGAWGAGFVLALSKRWPQPEVAYRKWPARTLGEVQFVDTDQPGLIVANMIAQHSTYFLGNRPPIRYVALANCLRKVGELADLL